LQHLPASRGSGCLEVHNQVDIKMERNSRRNSRRAPYSGYSRRRHHRGERRRFRVQPQEGLRRQRSRERYPQERSRDRFSHQQTRRYIPSHQFSPRQPRVPERISRQQHRIPEHSFPQQPQEHFPPEQQRNQARFPPQQQHQNRYASFRSQQHSRAPPSWITSPRGALEYLRSELRLLVQQTGQQQPTGPSLEPQRRPEQRSRASQPPASSQPPHPRLHPISPIHPQQRRQVPTFPPYLSPPRPQPIDWDSEEVQAELQQDLEDLWEALDDGITLGSEDEEENEKNESEQERQITSREYQPEDATETCSVCLDEFKEKQTLAIPKCNHCFHSHCLQEWSKRKSTCPVCRGKL
jgi:hypothetical protein